MATRGVVYVHSAPPALCPHVEWAVGGVLDQRVTLDWTPQPASPGAVRAELVGTGVTISTVLPAAVNTPDHVHHTCSSWPSPIVNPAQLPAQALLLVFGDGLPRLTGPPASGSAGSALSGRPADEVAVSSSPRGCSTDRSATSSGLWRGPARPSPACCNWRRRRGCHRCASTCGWPRAGPTTPSRSRRAASRRRSPPSTRSCRSVDNSRWR